MLGADKEALQSQVRVVHATRQLGGDAQGQLRKAEIMLELTSEYQKVQRLKEQAKTRNRDIQTEEEMLRLMVLPIYQADGDKAPVPGVTVKQFKHMVFDPEVAFAWCEQNAPALIIRTLSPDYGKVAENLPGAPINITYEPRVQIATDLSKAVTE